MARPRRSRRTLVIVAVLVLVSVTLITFDERSGSSHITSGLKSLAHDVFSPITSAVNDILHPIGDFFAGAVHYGSLQRENQELQATVGRLRLQLRENAGLATQNEELRKLARVSYLGGLPTITAPMINRNVSNFDADITIGKGRSAGVTVGEPVVAAGGLVGIVIEASHSTAEVQLITDGRSVVPVQFGPGNQTYATVTGEGAGRPLSVSFVPAQTNLHKGEPLYTNGLSMSQYPAGIPVGVVKSFRSTVGSGFMTVSMTPMANLDQLAYVDVVEWEPPL